MSPTILSTALTGVGFDRGMFGIALATTIAYCFAGLTNCLHFRKKYCTLRICRFGKMAAELGAVMRCRRGRWCSIEYAHAGKHIIGTLVLGAGQAVVPIVGMFFGEEECTALKAALKDTLRVGLVLAATAAVVLFLIPVVFAKLLGVTEPESLPMAMRAIKFFAVALPVQLINLVLLNFHQSTRSMAMATMICLQQSLIYITGFALLLVKPMGAYGGPSLWEKFAHCDCHGGYCGTHPKDAEIPA